MPQEEVVDVPNEDVDRVKREYEQDGATVTVTPNGDGKTSKVTATYP